MPRRFPAFPIAGGVGLILVAIGGYLDQHIEFIGWRRPGFDSGAERLELMSIATTACLVVMGCYYIWRGIQSRRMNQR